MKKVLVLGLFSASVAFAGGKDKEAPAFSALDKDGNGEIVADDVKDQPAHKEWDKLDADKDGKVTQAEYELVHKPKAKK